MGPIEIPQHILLFFFLGWREGVSEGSSAEAVVREGRGCGAPVQCYAMPRFIVTNCTLAASRHVIVQLGVGCRCIQRWWRWEGGLHTHNQDDEVIDRTGKERPSCIRVRREGVSSLEERHPPTHVQGTLLIWHSRSCNRIWIVIVVKEHSPPPPPPLL